MVSGPATDRALLGAVHAMAASARGADDQMDLVDRCTAVLLEITGADSAHVSRLDYARGLLRVLANAGSLAAWEEPHPEDEVYTVAGHPQVQSVAENAVSWTGSVEDPTTDARDAALLHALGKASALSVPVISGEVIWGEVYLTWASATGAAEAELGWVEVVAELLAYGLSRLTRGRMRELAYTDPLTQLANRRAVDDQLHAWAEDVLAAPLLSVVICDIDGLKSVNDQHGHLVGDRLLREVATLLSLAASRLHDGLAGRLGGDEFVLLSPTTDGDEVDAVVCDLQAAAAALPYGRGLSCGRASRQHLLRQEPVGGTGRALMRMADAEQYRDKLHGRPATTGPSPTRAAPVTVHDEHARLAAAVQRLIEDLGSGRPSQVADRLATVAATVCRATNGAAWWVSGIRDGRALAVDCGTHRDDAARDGQWPSVSLDLTSYSLSDFPETARAVAGGSFAVDATRGDAAERRLLAQDGFRSVVAAGGPHPPGAAGAPTAASDEPTAWLVEIYGDALTPELSRVQALLQSLTAFALSTSTAP